MNQQEIGRIVEKMPKLPNPGTDNVFLLYALSAICDAQCRLLAEQGWRKVPSEKEILGQLSDVDLSPNCRKWIARDDKQEERISHD